MHFEILVCSCEFFLQFSRSLTVKYRLMRYRGGLGKYKYLNTFDHALAHGHSLPIRQLGSPTFKVEQSTGALSPRDSRCNFDIYLPCYYEYKSLTLLDGLDQPVHRHVCG